MAVSSEPANSIGEFLTQRGWISGVELHYARQSQGQLGGRLETCLLAQRALDEEQLLEALGQFHNLPSADAQDLQRAPEKATQAVPAQVARQLRAVPFSIVGDELWVAIESPDNESIASQLEAVTELPVRLHIASEPRIAEALERHYGLACSARIRQLLSRLASPTMDASNSSPSTPADDQKGKNRREKVSPEPDSGIHSIPAGVQSAFERRLSHTKDSREVFATVLDYFAREFQRVAIFRVSGNTVQGWIGRGGGVRANKLRNLTFGLNQPSVFLNLQQGAPFHLGVLPPMEAHEHLAEILGGRLPDETLLLPIRLAGRLVAVIYCDRGGQGMAGIDLGEVQRITAVAATSLERHLLHRKLRKT